PTVHELAPPDVRDQESAAPHDRTRDVVPRHHAHADDEQGDHDRRHDHPRRGPKAEKSTKKLASVHPGRSLTFAPPQRRARVCFLLSCARLYRSRCAAKPRFMATSPGNRNFVFEPTPAVTASRTRVRYVNCAVCQTDYSSYLFSKVGVRFVKCKSCGLVYV